MAGRIPLKINRRKRQLWGRTSRNPRPGSGWLNDGDPLSKTKTKQTLKPRQRQ